MTRLSVNINKVALLRNSRGRDFPNVREFATRCLDLGAHGITLHPRPDQRHARYSDIVELMELCAEKRAELNVEGYPSDEFLAQVLAARPAQCTLVPDAPGQLTSDHGWAILEKREFLTRTISRLRDQGIRVSLFVDYDYRHIEAAREVGADRIELYTEPYASAYPSDRRKIVWGGFLKAAFTAHNAGLGINAGHDLSLSNLPHFLNIPHLLEVSIGHALIIECLELGLPTVINRYLQIIAQANEVTSSQSAEKGQIGPSS